MKVCITASEGVQAPGLMPASPAAAWLAQHAPVRDATQWGKWLRHNARPGRYVRYRIPCHRVAKRLMFDMDTLQHVAQLEMSRCGYVLLTPATATWVAQLTENKNNNEETTL